MHAGDVGLEAGGVGHRGHLDHRLGAVDELDQHARVHVALARLFLELVGRRVELQRIVLALARSDDLEADRLGEADQLDGGGRLVARRAGEHHARFLRLGLEEAADGDVGFDVEHDDVLAVLHRLERDERADVGVAGGVDDHVDAARRAQRGVVVGQRHLALLDRPIDVGRLGGGDDVARLTARQQHRVARRLGADLRHRAKLDALHQRDVDDHVGAHLPRARQTDHEVAARLGLSVHRGCEPNPMQ